MTLDKQNYLFYCLQKITQNRKIRIKAVQNR